MDAKGNDDVVDNANPEAGTKKGCRKGTLADFYPDPLGEENSDKDRELTDDIVRSKMKAVTLQY